MKTYQILISQSSWESKVKPYFDALKPYIASQGKDTAAALQPGKYLKKQLAANHVDSLEDDNNDNMSYCISMMERLINTKRPQIFAESAVHGHGDVDWNQAELSILGDIAIAVPVTIYDNGRHDATAADIHDTPFDGHLLYVPGALLRNGQGQEPCDLAAVTENGKGRKIDPQRYYKLYKERILPSLLYANDVCRKEGKRGFITIPGLGCGQFAGKFSGRLLHQLLGTTIHRILQEHKDDLTSIDFVHYDPFSDGENESFDVGHMKYRIRPLRELPMNVHGRDTPQLSSLSEFVEGKEDLSNGMLFSFVAWDHVSWPGNDYWIGSRATDDGVKAAATSSMAVMTGMEGSYNRSTFCYDPPHRFRGWKSVVRHAEAKPLRIKVSPDNFQRLDPTKKE
jgi:hypothetical protein